MRQTARRLRLVGLAPRALEVVQVVQVRGELAPNAGHGGFAVVVDDPGKLPGRGPDEERGKFGAFAAAGAWSCCECRGWAGRRWAVLWLRTIVARIDARVISCAIDLNPVGAVDATLVARDGTHGKRRRHLDPAGLFR